MTTPAKVGRPLIQRTPEYQGAFLEKERLRGIIFKAKIKLMTPEEKLIPLKLGRPVVVRTPEELLIEKERKRLYEKERYRKKVLARLQAVE